jgi:hypothetical protein
MSQAGQTKTPSRSRKLSQAGTSMGNQGPEIDHDGLNDCKNTAEHQMNISADPGGSASLSHQGAAPPRRSQDSFPRAGFFQDGVKRFMPFYPSLTAEMRLAFFRVV